MLVDSKISLTFSKLELQHVTLTLSTPVSDIHQNPLNLNSLTLLLKEDSEKFIKFLYNNQQTQIDMQTQHKPHLYNIFVSL